MNHVPKANKYDLYKFIIWFYNNLSYILWFIFLLSKYRLDHKEKTVFVLLFVRIKCAIGILMVRN
jgi:hypothetical protein